MRASAVCISFVAVVSACGPDNAADDAGAATTSGAGSSGTATTTAAATMLPTGESTDAADTTGGELPAVCTPAEQWVGAGFGVNHHKWAADGEPLALDVPCDVIHVSPSSEILMYIDMLCTDPMGAPHEVQISVVNTAIYPDSPLSDGQQVTLHLRLPDAAEEQRGVFAIRDLAGALRVGGIQASEPDPESILAPWTITLLEGLCPGVTVEDCGDAIPLGVELKRGDTTIMLGHHQEHIVDEKTYIAVEQALAPGDDPLACKYGGPERLSLVLYEFE